MLTKRPPPGLLAAPSPKRVRSTAHGGGGEASVQPLGPLPPPPSSLGKRQLRSRMLVLFFVVNVKEDLRNRRLRRVIREENSISQNKALEAFENALQKQLYPIHCSLESLNKRIGSSLESLNKRIDVLSHDVEQIKHSNPNGYAYEHYSSEANQEHTAVVKVTNQEQTTAVDGLTMSEACEDAAVQLRFLNCSKPLLYTERKITAEGGMAIKIAIFRDNQIISSGRLSSARIEILALHGDFFDVVPNNWTECEFDGRIVSSREGPVLGGDCQLKLKNGVVSLDDICFKKVSSKTDSGKLILVARVHKSDKAGLRVKEAVMNPVKVQVSRNELNVKSNRPKLKDEVYRLRGISGKGPPFKMLQENEIYTVEDFRKAVNKNKEKIRNECFKLKKDNKLWEAIVKHAEECDLEGNCKLKSYIVEEQNVVLFFNCVYDLVGTKFHGCDGCYITKDNFNSAQQDVVNQLKEQAYDKLDSIQFDHEIKDNYPIPLSTTTNTSIGVEGTATVQTVQCTQINHAPELPNAHNNVGAGKIILAQSASGPILSEPHCANGYQGGQMVCDAQVAIAGGGYYMAQSSDVPPVITAEASGVNYLVGATQYAPDLAIYGYFPVPSDLPLDSTQPENQGSAAIDWTNFFLDNNSLLKVEASTSCRINIPQHQFSQDQLIEHPSNAQNDGLRRSAYPGPGYSNY